MKYRLNKYLWSKLIIVLALIAPLAIMAQVMPPSIEESASEPVIYDGDRIPDARYFDGKLPHAVGVHHYQVYRANRSNPLKSSLRNTSRSFSSSSVLHSSPA